MVITEPAVICLEAAWMRLLHVLRLSDAGSPPPEWDGDDAGAPSPRLRAPERVFGPGADAGEAGSGLEPGGGRPGASPDAPTLAGRQPPPVDVLSDADPAADPEPAALEEPVALDVDRRRAQAAALRAMLLARRRRFAQAEAAFAEAAALDPACDLTASDGFWNLERAGHEAAARAYDRSGRPRDALLLRAKIEERYRPRLVRSA